MMSSFQRQPLTRGNMLYKGTASFVLIAVFMQVVIADQNMCQNAVAPPSKPRGVNQINRTSATPLFELQVTPVEIQEGTDQLTAYKIGVTIEGGMPFRFTEATIAVSTNGSCGSGDFDFRLKDYVEIDQDQADNCPRLFQTKRKTHMTELLPLIWVPPTCGCVTLRMLLVEAAEIYYAENEGVIQGPLAKTLCFQPPTPTQISRDRRLEGLCHVIDKHSSGEILSRGQFLRHRGLEPRWMDHLGLEMALELRRSDAKTCCKEVQYEDKMQCFDDARRRRIDQFCEDGIPDIPFRSFRRKHMRDLERSCCFILGEHRYTCFSTNIKMDADKDDTTLFDFSMDASDLVNDLADFGSHEYLDPYLKPIQFGSDEVDDLEDDDEDDEDFSNTDSDKDEDKGVFGPIVKDPTLTPSKRIYPQRSPPRYSSRGVKKSSFIRPTPISSSTSTISSAILSQRDLKRQMRRKSKSRNFRRVSERKGGRGGWGKKSGRRGSAERRTNAERRTSGERRASSERRSSAERRESSGRRTSAERRASSERHVSAERRNRAWKMSKARYDEGNERVSFYTPDVDVVRTGVRRRMDLDGDSVMPNQYGFDDQEKPSTDRTLKKLKRRMQRLKLLNMCCKAGTDIGGQVYGGIESVTNECRHSSDKFVRGVSLGGKTRKCANQFVDCCLEEAKKGLTVTSQEFIENTMDDYWENPHQYDPNLVGRVLAQRGRRPASFSDRRRPATPRASRDEHLDPPEASVERREEPIDRKSIPQSAKIDPRKGVENVVPDRTVLPRGLNKDLQQDLSRLESSATSTGKLGQKSTEDFGIRGKGLVTDRFDEAKKRVLKKGNLPEKSDEGQILQVPKNVSVVRFDDNQVDEKQNSSKSSRDAINETGILDDKDIDGSSKKSKNGVLPQMATGVTKANPNNSHSNQYNDKTVAAKGELKAKLQRKISKKSKAESDADDHEFVSLKPNQHQPSMSRNTHASMQSTSQKQPDRNTPTNNRRRKQNQRTNPNSRKEDPDRFKSRIDALDSREMAARNTKQYIEALDSREMADQYINNNNKKRRKMYRKGTRNYRFPSSFSNSRRRTRIG